MYDSTFDPAFCTNVPEIQEMLEIEQEMEEMERRMFDVPLPSSEDKCLSKVKHNEDTCTPNIQR